MDIKVCLKYEIILSVHINHVLTVLMIFADPSVKILDKFSRNFTSTHFILAAND